MKKTFLWLLSGLVLMLSTVCLPACNRSSGGGGGGGGGTGGVQTTATGFTKGVITAKGTIIVNDVEFNTTGATIMVNDNAGTESDLQVGQVVSMKGTMSGSTGTATQVVFMDDLTGPISAISGTLASAGTMTATIMGQTVVIDSRTSLMSSGSGSITTLATGSVVEVSGLPDEAGNLRASFIQSKATGTAYNIRGFVSSATGSVISASTMTFTLSPNINGGTAITVSLGPGATLPSDFAANKFVNVTIDPATFTDTTATTLTAKSVTVENELLPAENDRVSVEGFSTAATGTTAGANSFTIDGFPVNAGTIEMPPMNTKVIVVGTVTNGVINAEKIELADTSVFAIGPLSTLTTMTGVTGTNTVALNGSLFDISTALIKVNGMPGTISDLEPGKQAIVKSAITLSTSTTGTSGIGSGGTGTSGVGSGGTGTGGVQLVACPASGTTDVTIQDFSFTPANVTITANTTVKWTNNGPSVHTVTSMPGSGASFDSGAIAPGTSACFTFPEAGSFNYLCSIHPTLMMGSVTVTGTGGGGGIGSGGTGTTGLLSSITNTATLVWIVDNLTGPISSTSFSLSTGTTGTSAMVTLMVMGQNVNIDSNTKFGKNIMSTGTGSVMADLSSLGTGSVVNVSGTPDGNGNLLATFIDSQPTATGYHVLGIVSGVTGSPVTNFTLTPEGGQPLIVSLASGVTPSTGFGEGQLVDVKVLPSTFANPASTAVTAESVVVVNKPKPGETDKVDVKGVVYNLAGSTFTVNGINVDASAMPGGMPAEITAGSTVLVRGTMTQAVLRPEQIQMIM